MLYQTRWIGLLTPSREREADDSRFRRHILLYWTPEACQHRQGNRTYRSARSPAARRELASSDGERYLAPGYGFISRDSWLGRLNASHLPTGASLWHKASDGPWWTAMSVNAERAPRLYEFRAMSGPDLSDCLRNAILRR